VVIGSLAISLLLAAPAPADDVVVLHVGKLLTMNGADEVVAPGMLVLEDGKIAYAGPVIEPQPGMPEPVLALDAWATPGLVDLHTHIHSGGFGDVNDMVNAVNPELRASPAYRPDNGAIRVGRAGGVTTLFGIPGSGTNMGGFGIVYKSRSTGYPESVVRDPGGLKVAQDSNPQRRNGTDVGVTRAGMEWNLRDVADRALAAYEQGRRDPALENLGRIMSNDLPVLIHTAGSEGVVNTARMWKVKYGCTAVVSHGSFDGWKVAPALGEIGIPVNHGPRTIDYYSSREGRIVGSAAEFVKGGVPLFSLNTDSSVIPQELFFLQGSMSARYGADPYLMLRALTIHPAISFNLAHRVGSLEVGKDADVVLWDGDPLDPRSAVLSVYIDGALEYDRDRDGQIF
jgi:imidazolonepropionase-like amidohydrolase